MTFTTPEAGNEDLGDLLLEVLPGDGSIIGNLSAREPLNETEGGRHMRSMHAGVILLYPAPHKR